MLVGAEGVSAGRGTTGGGSRRPDVGPLGDTSCYASLRTRIECYRHPGSGVVAACLAASRASRPRRYRRRCARPAARAPSGYR